MCIIFNRIQKIKDGTNPYFVKELDTGYVIIGDNQYFRGYTLFLFKEHVKELYKLDDNVRVRFLDEMTIAAKAVSKAFGAEKMNYECLGNGDAYPYRHLFPRVSGDPGMYRNEGNGPVWRYPKKKMYSDDTRPGSEELDELEWYLKKELYLLSIR